MQLFTYDKGWNAVNLLRALEAIFEDAGKLRVVWTEHDATRRTCTVLKILSARLNGIRFNDCYVQSPVKRLSPALKAIEVFEVIVHLNLSPDCCVWAQSADQMLDGKTPVRKVISGVLSLERSAKYRKPEVMASALEITLMCNSNNLTKLITIVCDLITTIWSRIECSDKFGTVDVGGEWLFFPRTGYNPNLSKLFAYYSL